ncbi:hypothetical protein KFE25_006350 [Diacronema lutheri]|uniref:Nudix hydrolase domain-containing protein n=1 Tax=Diacronema lutheri TaxID=2081491 RepID=A0A8J6CH73_DIALT|nr:hypothetical protein KFE25_006350 [Diacronema lutheri]
MPLVPAAGPPLVDLLDDLVSRFVLNCPEEEKASFDRLFFQIESAYWFYDDHYREKYPDQYPTLTLKGFAEKLFKHCDVLKPYKGQSAELFAKFTDYKGQVPTYGAVILDRTLTKLLLIRSWHGSTWSFPKGKINKDEAEHECAIREVLEEIGLDLRMYLDTSQFLEHSYGRGTTMKLFLTHGVDESVHLETRTKKEIGAIVWHPLSELGTESTKKDKDYWIVQQLIGRIKKWAGERRKEVKGSAAGGKDSRRGAAAAQSPPAAQSLQVLPALAAYAYAHKPLALPPPAGASAPTGGAAAEDSFMFSYERERVDVYGGGVIEGGHHPSGAARSRASGKLPAAGRSRALNDRETFQLGDAKAGSNGWSVEEMFRTNEEKFNLRSTYNFELYTTSLSGRKPADETRAAETTQAARVRRAAQPPPMQVPATATGESQGARAVAPAAPAAPRAQHGQAASASHAPFRFDRTAIMDAFDAEMSRRRLATA